MSSRSTLVLTAMMLLGSAGFAQTPAAPAPPPADLTAPPVAGKTASGLSTRVLEPGDGKNRPGAKDFVTLQFTGWTRDGKVFENTLAGDGPITVALERLMKGMGEGIALMTRGERRRLWIPQELAFAGRKGRPEGDLVLDVQLLEIEPSPTVPPADVAGVPGDALLLPSGLAYKVLRPGTGKDRPSRRDTVTVHYSGWTTDGKLFDSTRLRGGAGTFKVTEVISGWTEILQRMTKGEKLRVWIPQNLAYHGDSGKPAGMLVFDMELLAFWN